MRAELEGVPTPKVDVEEFEAMTDEQLDKEWNWLYDMVFLK
jgi:hypothetical protein